MSERLGRPLLGQNVLNERQAKAELINRNNEQLHTYLAGFTGALEEIDKDLTNEKAYWRIKPFVDIRSYPDTTSYYTFPLCSDDQRGFGDAEGTIAENEVEVVCFGMDSLTFDPVSQTGILDIIIQDDERAFYHHIRGVTRERQVEIMREFAKWLGRQETVPVALEKAHAFFNDRLALSERDWEPKLVSKYRYFPDDAKRNKANLIESDPTAWLKEKFVNTEPVDQGNETIVATTIGGIDINVLASGPTRFVLNDLPIDKVVEAAMREGIDVIHGIETHELLQQLREQQATVSETGEKYKKFLRRYKEKTGRDVQEDWPSAEPELRYDTVRDCYYLDILGQPVMNEFERQYIEFLGANVAKYGGAVLEVGFGMGISATAIQKRLAQYQRENSGKPCVHVIIELNHGIAEKAREWARHQEIPVIILEGDWREQIQKIPRGVLTGCLSDPFALNESDVNQDAAEVMPQLENYLKEGGILGLYADATTQLNEQHKKLAGKRFPWRAGATAMFGGPRNPGKYFGEMARMFVSFLYKDGGTAPSTPIHKELSREQKIDLLHKLILEFPTQFLDLNDIDPRKTADLAA